MLKKKLYCNSFSYVIKRNNYSLTNIVARIMCGNKTMFCGFFIYFGGSIRF